MITKPKILVGCPTYELFEYCLDEYSKAVKSLTYPNYDYLLSLEQDIIIGMVVLDSIIDTSKILIGKT